MRAGIPVIIMITPDLFLIMCGATAFAVRNCVLVAIVIAPTMPVSAMSPRTTSGSLNSARPPARYARLWFGAGSS